MGRCGGAICWEVRLEAVREEMCGVDADGLGEGGTELRSGAILLKAEGLWEEDKS